MKLSTTGARKVAALKAGTPNDPRSFIKPYIEESVTAAYNGFDDVADLRNFLILNQFLVGYHFFKSINAGLAVHTAQELLRDDLVTIGSVRTLDEAAANGYPLAPKAMPKEPISITRLRLCCTVSHPGSGLKR